MAPRKDRGLVLTDRALTALGVQPSRRVPLLDLPWREEERDRKGEL